MPLRSWHRIDNFKKILYLFQRILGKERAAKLNHFLSSYTIKLAAISFVILAILNAVRVFRGTELVYGSYSVPMWISTTISIISSLFAYGLWKRK